MESEPDRESSKFGTMRAGWIVPASVLLAATRGDKTLAALAEHCEVNANRIT